MAMAVTVASALVVVLILLLWVAGNYLRRDLEKRARDYALLSTPGVTESYERYHGSGVYKMRQQIEETLRRSEDVVSASVVDTNGNVLFDSAAASDTEEPGPTGSESNDPWIVEAARRLEPSARRLSSSRGEAEYEVVAPHTGEWGQRRLSVVYRFSYGRLRARIGYALALLGSVSAIAIALAFVVGSLAARRVSRPLAVMTRRVEEIGKGERGSRIEIDPGAFDELRIFAEAFNAMAAELDHHLETLRQSNLDLSIANATLEAKNAELERYAYTTSHELRTPLITIRTFANTVEREAAALGSTRIQADTARISNAVQRMSERLEGLLSLARLGRIANESQIRSVSALAGEAVTLSAGDLGLKGVRVQIQPRMPEVRVDAVRFVEVFQNLIENAIKFTGNSEAPAIEIGMRVEGDQRVFFVKDNGIGIAPRFHETIFGLFEKLDPGSEGSGVGLAVVRRIVEVHGGRIWVESAGEGQGAAFCFTLPELDAQSSTSMRVASSSGMESE